MARRRHAPPVAPYASVQYRGTWFWVADDDLITKRALMAVMFFFTLMGERGEEQLPLITIPAQ